MANLQQLARLSLSPSQQSQRHSQRQQVIWQKRSTTVRTSGSLNRLRSDARREVKMCCKGSCFDHNGRVIPLKQLCLKVCSLTKLCRSTAKTLTILMKTTFKS